MQAKALITSESSYFADLFALFSRVLEMRPASAPLWRAWDSTGPLEEWVPSPVTSSLSWTGRWTCSVKSWTSNPLSYRPACKRHISGYLVSLTILILTTNLDDVKAFTKARPKCSYSLNRILCQMGGNSSCITNNPFAKCLRCETTCFEWLSSRYLLPEASTNLSISWYFVPFAIRILWLSLCWNQQVTGAIAKLRIWPFFYL